MDVAWLVSREMLPFRRKFCVNQKQIYVLGATCVLVRIPLFPFSMPLGHPGVGGGGDKKKKDVPLVKFIYLVFARMPVESYGRPLGSLLLC